MIYQAANLTISQDTLVLHFRALPLGQSQEAIALYEQQLVITREIGDRRGEGSALGNFGIAYANLGQSQEAIALYEQHLAIAPARLAIGAAKEPRWAIWEMLTIT